MVAAVDLSVVASAALGVLWQLGESRPMQEGPITSTKDPMELLWRLVMQLKELNQVLPAVFAFLAADSITGFNVAAFTLFPASEDAGWLGAEPLSFYRQFALLLSLTIWRADKLHSLLQRAQRSVGVIKAEGPGTALKNAVSDVSDYAWPGIWGLGRRAANITISALGCVPFVKCALPAVVMDECLWYVLSKSQDLFGRKVMQLPPVFDVLILPILDLLHFIPVMCQVFYLAIFEYPDYDISGTSKLILVLCALSWTGHNCNIFYTSACMDIPENASQLWAGNSGAGQAE
eukprot:TRINITY_DN34903_c0_g1_i1.p1 TRINITY_DN34903_c0_g1~~TRINITY_DN34903_c0_g1_i1.p1  ORF type:complete len:290 (-),score=54.94 TRINITY_DN34903_c0_g1_i1:372-1241(-)